MLTHIKRRTLFGLIKGVSPSFKPNQESKRFSRGTSREEFGEKVEALLFNLTREERYSRRASQEGQELPLT